MGDVLGRIDATLEGRCVCGCGILLDERSPSGWFASEGCQERWYERQGFEPEVPRQGAMQGFEASYFVMDEFLEWRARVDPNLEARQAGRLGVTRGNPQET